MWQSDQIVKYGGEASSYSSSYFGTQSKTLYETARKPTCSRVNFTDPLIPPQNKKYKVVLPLIHIFTLSVVQLLLWCTVASQQQGSWFEFCVDFGLFSSCLRRFTPGAAVSSPGQKIHIWFNQTGCSCECEWLSASMCELCDRPLQGVPAPGQLGLTLHRISSKENGLMDTNFEKALYF